MSQTRLLGKDPVHALYSLKTMDKIKLTKINLSATDPLILCYIFGTMDTT